MLQEHEVYKLIKELKEFLMSATDDLNASLAALDTTIASVLTALGSSTGTTDDAAIEAAVTQLNSINSQLQSALSAAPTGLNASMPVSSGASVPVAGSTPPLI